MLGRGRVLVVLAVGYLKSCGLPGETRGISHKVSQGRLLSQQFAELIWSFYFLRVSSAKIGLFSARWQCLYWRREIRVAPDFPPFIFLPAPAF